MPSVKNKVRLCTTSPMSIFIVENLGGTPFYNRRDDFERLLDKYVTNPRYKNFFAMPYYEPALHGLEWHVDPEFAHAVKLSSLAGTQQYYVAKNYIAEATAYFRNLVTQVEDNEQPYFNCLIKYIDSTDIDEMAFVTPSQVILGVWGIMPMPGQNMNTSVVTEVDDNRLHRVSFETNNATLKGTKSFMRRHGYKLHPGIDVPKVIPDDGYVFVSWMPFDPNNAQVNEDLHFVAQCEKVATPPPFQEPIIVPPPVEVTPPEPQLCQVTFTDGTYGTLSGPSPSIKVPAGTVLTPSMIPLVTPLSGYSFLGWDKPLEKPITGDTTFVAQYSKVPWWRRWLADGCLRWLLMALLALLLFLLFAIVLTRCTSCSGAFGGCVRDAHDKLVGTTDTIRTPRIGNETDTIRTHDGRHIDDNGNRRGVRDISDDLDGDEEVAPPLVDEDGNPISEPGLLDPDDPNSPKVMSDRLNRIIPDQCSLFILILGVLSIAGDLAEGSLWFSPEAKWYAPIINRVLAMLIGYGLLWLINFLCVTFLGKEGMGQGDMKLLGACGLLVGCYGLTVVLYVGFVTALFFALPLYIRKRLRIRNEKKEIANAEDPAAKRREIMLAKKNMHFADDPDYLAFGPFLAFGAAVFICAEKFFFLRIIGFFVLAGLYF